MPASYRYAIGVGSKNIHRGASLCAAARANCCAAAIMRPAGTCGPASTSYSSSDSHSMRCHLRRNISRCSPAVQRVGRAQPALLPAAGGANGRGSNGNGDQVPVRSSQQLQQRPHVPSAGLKDAPPADAAGAAAAVATAGLPSTQQNASGNGASVAESSYDELTFLPEHFQLQPGKLSAVDRTSQGSADDVFRCPGCTRPECMVSVGLGGHSRAYRHTRVQQVDATIA